MFKRASLIYDEERKFEERKESFLFESKEIGKEPEEKSMDEKTTDKLGKYSESISPELEKKEVKESPKLEQKQEKKEEATKEKEEEVKTMEVQIETFIPPNISKGLEEVLNFLKETCPLKYVIQLKFYSDFLYF